MNPFSRYAGGAFAVVTMALAGAGPVLAQPSDAQAADDPVVAVVDRIEVRRSDLEMLHATLPQQYRQLPLQMIERQLLARLVDRILLARAARRAGLADKDDVKRRLAFMEQGVLQEAFLQEKIESAFTEERLRAAYDKMTAEREPEEEVHARHILLKAEEDAKRVIASLRGGADFAETAKAESTGPSAAQGGDLGYFTRGQMVAEFATAAFEMSAGSFSAEPVKTEFGWHVILVVDRRQAAPPGFDESQDELRTMVARAVVAETVASLRDAADVRMIGGEEADPDTGAKKKDAASD